MTLIVKELVVRGNVLSENSPEGEFSFEKDSLSQHLEQLKREIEKECIEKVLQKLETKALR